MAHFAQLDENATVVAVIVVNNEVINNLDFPDSESIGIEFCQSLYGSFTIWKQTSYNGNFRKNYAGIGDTYDTKLDAFIAKKTYPSWVLNTDTYKWIAPIPYPMDGKYYEWNERTISWVAYTGRF